MRKIIAAVVFAAIATSPLLAATAQAQTPIKIMVGGIDKQIYLPAKLAAQLGFFKEQGLDVELFNSTSGSQAATALWPARCRAWSGSTTTPSTCNPKASSSPRWYSSPSPRAKWYW